MKTPHIILIIPYFGKFNNYFPFFLTSCLNNPTVNWLIITDDKSNYDYPENVKVMYSTFQELRDRVQATLDFPISLESPYKLCDFRPAYGLVFNNEIKGYDFWGYCDNDLIFGDIRSFLTDDVLEGKEKVLSRGHLSLYRNNSYMNSFFKTHTGDFYKTALSSNKGYSFDEWGPYGIANHLKCELPKEKFWDGFPFDDLWTLGSNFIPAQKRHEDKRNIIYSYNDGTLTKFAISGGVVSSEPVLYAHFQKRPLSIETSETNKYLIIPNRIIPYITPDIAFLKRYGRPKLINTQYFRIKYANLKRFIKGIKSSLLCLNFFK